MRLRFVLRLNIALSTLTGLVGLLFAGPVADVLGVDQVWLVRLLGGGLLAFALGVFIVAGSTTKTLRAWSLEISIADLGWVVGTAVVIGLGWLSTSGVIVMSVVAVMILGLSAAQFRARNHLILAETISLHAAA